MKENQRIVMTKRLLKDALLRLLKTKELGKISITELCRESEINRATFYRHYTLPRDVLVDIENDFIRELHASTKFIKSESDAEQMLEHWCLYFYEHSALVKYFMDNNLDKSLELILSDFFQKLIRSDNASKSESDEVNRTIVNTYLSGGAYLVLRRWINGDFQKTPKEIAQISLKLLNGDLEF